MSAKIIAAIQRCDDPKALRNYIKNAENKGERQIALAAMRQLFSIVPGAEPSTVEYEFGRTMNALEFRLSQGKKKKVRLQRTRNKIAKAGIVQTIADLASGQKQEEGFKRLIEFGMAEMTAEAIVLRHPNVFDEAVCSHAKRKLTEAGVDVDALPKATRAEATS